MVSAGVIILRSQWDVEISPDQRLCAIQMVKTYADGLDEAASGGGGG